MKIPALSCNFLQIPESFCDLLITLNLTRNEILVLVCLAKRTFGLNSTKALVPVEDIIRTTRLASDAVDEAISRSIDRDLIIRFEVEGAGGPPLLYALNTAENAILAGYEVSSTTPERPITQAADSTIPPSSSVLDEIHRLIGRGMTKDELARISSLRAPESELLEALRNLEERKIKLYSSDQIVYEVETIQMRRRQEVEHMATIRKNRGPTCQTCGGLGYVFSGTKSVKSCECRR